MPKPHQQDGSTLVAVVAYLVLVRVVKTSILPGSIGTTYPERDTASILVVWNDQAQMRRQSYIGSCCMRLDPCVCGPCRKMTSPPWTAKSTARCRISLHQRRRRTWGRLAHQIQTRRVPSITTGRNDETVVCASTLAVIPSAPGTCQCVGAFCTTV
jgi:hypothetical protein